MPAGEIARHSTKEIVAALAATDAPWWLRRAIALGAAPASARLARRLRAFDAAIAARGLAAAARSFLDAMGARVTVLGAPPRGAALVVMNHPGAYDALATMAALGRDDVVFLAKERPFLRALPNLRAHLAFVGGAAGLKAAVRSFARGGVVVQLGAGAIEPDARFERAAASASWPPGSGLLAERAGRAGAAVIPAFVAGVHSPRAKRLAIVRWAEARGISTIGPLIQATVPGFRDVEVTLHFGAPLTLDVPPARGAHEARTALLHARVHALAPVAR
ncbi:MAG: hypothetical protein KIT84_07020 [Labilithrix sp.]|nr:hypothetical protein [Labilithrix sp.]MCW5810746.1 hypothetical protein [Labilithrix sp.]